MLPHRPVALYRNIIRLPSQICHRNFGRFVSNPLASIPVGFQNAYHGRKNTAVLSMQYTSTAWKKKMMSDTSSVGRNGADSGNDTGSMAGQRSYNTGGQPSMNRTDEQPTPLYDANHERVVRLRRVYAAQEDRIHISPSSFSERCDFVTSCNSIETIERRVDSRHRRRQPQHTVAEVCFIGRSNVGKSSLINALVSKNDLVKTSKTPVEYHHDACRTGPMASGSSLLAIEPLTHSNFPFHTGVPI